MAFPHYKNLESHLSRNLERLDHYLQDTGLQNYCAVFDVGTNAVRVLVAPRMKIEQFRNLNANLKSPFYIATHYTELGTAVKDRIMVPDRKFGKLGATIEFIKKIRSKLKVIEREDIVLIGTQVFREIDNGEEITTLIKDETGLNLEIIDWEKEAYFSYLAVNNSVDFVGKSDRNSLRFSARDAFMVCDQGGGSTEVSYFIAENRGDYRSISLQGLSLAEVGRVFWEEPVGNGKLHPTVLQAAHCVRAYIKEKMDALYPFQLELLITAGSKESAIHLFGMGTAVVRMFERCFENWTGEDTQLDDLHNCSIDYGIIRKRYKEIVERLNSTYATLPKLKAAVLKSAQTDKELVKEVQLVLTMPTFEFLMERFDIKHLRYSYYNMKFGIYLERFVEGR